VAIASAGNPQVTFNLVDCYHIEACLMGVDTLKRSFGGSANILMVLLPGFKERVVASRIVTVSLDDALNAYRAIAEGSSGKKFVIRFG
jgi:hypothetical protein